MPGQKSAGMPMKQPLYLQAEVGGSVVEESPGAPAWLPWVYYEPA